MTVERPAGGTLRFRDELDERNADIWQSIVELPFLRELSDSTLPESRFGFFIVQDLIYLDEFARVLAIGAARSRSTAEQEMFLRHAQGVTAVEQALHISVAPQLGLDPEQIRHHEPAPVTAAYTDHLLSVAHGSGIAELVAAVLPCYDVYRRVGEHLSARMPARPLYAGWVASYASPAFAASVEEQLDLIDRLASTESGATRERMARLYRKSIRYEWMFWQQAYDRLDWPIARSRASSSNG